MSHLLQAVVGAAVGDALGVPYEGKERDIHGQLPVCKCSGDFLSLFALLRAKCTP